MWCHPESNSGPRAPKAAHYNEPSLFLPLLLLAVHSTIFILSLFCKIFIIIIIIIIIIISIIIIIFNLYHM